MGGTPGSRRVVENGTCKSLGLRTTLLSALANQPQSPGWGNWRGPGEGGPEGALEQVAGVGCPGAGLTLPLPQGCTSFAQVGRWSRMQDV